MGSFKLFLKDLFFPARCVVCGGEPDGREDGLLCRICGNRYENERHSRCAVCGHLYRECDCRPQFDSPYIANYVRVTYYHESRVAGKLVLAAKDRSNRRLTAHLAREMARAVRARGCEPEVVSYIPCSDESYRKKGFDHGRNLANALAKELAVPAVNCFERKKGKEQKHLNAEARLANSKASLRAKRLAEAAVKGKRVLLLDDIMTTGASSLVASVHLDKMGAKSIDFVCFGSR